MTATGNLARRVHLQLASESGDDVPAAGDAPARSAAWTLSRRMLKASLWSTLTLGASFGAVNLLTVHYALGPVPPSHNWVHATFQLIGFVLLFVMGIAYQAIPRSCGVPLGSLRLARASFALVGGGLLLRFYGLFGALVPGAPGVLLAGGVAVTAGVVAFAATLASTWRTVPAPRPRVGMPALAAGTAWWTIAAALLIVEGVVAVAAGDSDFSAQYNEAFYMAALLGGTMSWIQGMVRRMEPAMLALPAPRMRSLDVAFWLTQIAAAAATTGAALQSTAVGHVVFDAGLLVAVIATAALIHGTRVFGGAVVRPRSSHLAPPRVRRTVRFAFASVALFAVLAAAYGAADLAGHMLPTAVWDGARHALALGFVTPLILALGSHIIPRVSGVPLRRPGWCDAGLVLIAVGLVAREMQVVAALGILPRLLLVSGLSGIVAATGVILAGGALLGTLRGSR